MVVMLDEVANGVLPLQGAAVDAAPNLFFGQLGEPAFHQVEPRSRRGVKCRWKRGRLASQRRVS